MLHTNSLFQPTIARPRISLTIFGSGITKKPERASFLLEHFAVYVKQAFALAINKYYRGYVRPKVEKIEITQVGNFYRCAWRGLDYCDRKVKVEGNFFHKEVEPTNLSIVCITSVISGGETQVPYQYFCLYEVANQYDMMSNAYGFVLERHNYPRQVIYLGMPNLDFSEEKMDQFKQSLVEMPPLFGYCDVSPGFLNLQFLKENGLFGLDVNMIGRGRLMGVSDDFGFPLLGKDSISWAGDGHLLNGYDSLPRFDFADDLDFCNDLLSGLIDDEELENAHANDRCPTCHTTGFVTKYGINSEVLICANCSSRFKLLELKPEPTKEEVVYFLGEEMQNLNEEDQVEHLLQMYFQSYARTLSGLTAKEVGTMTMLQKIGVLEEIDKRSLKELPMAVLGEIRAMVMTIDKEQYVIPAD